MTDPLFLDDDELAERLFKDRARRQSFKHQIPLLEARGFPRQSVEFGGCRYWPAVKRYFDQMWSVQSNAAPAGAEDGEENWSDEQPTFRNRRKTTRTR
jgi:hypothetical protein